MSSNAESPALQAGKLPGPLLDRLIENYRTLPDPDVIVPTGYGRDAAAISVGGSTPLIVKSDPITFATSAAARYLLAVNANDLACLGGTPRWLSVVALLPVGTTEAEVESLFADLKVTCDANGVAIVGGHTEVTPAVNHTVLVGTRLGTVDERGLLEPGGARVGDDLLLTRVAGIEGTALLARERTGELAEALGMPLVSSAAKLLQMPGINIVAAAHAVRSVDGVTALHDPTEGGIATAIHELASGSACGAEVMLDALPILPETQAIAQHFGLNPLGLLSSGALLIAANPKHRSAVEHASLQAGIPITWIGRLTERELGVTMLTSTGREPLPRFDADEVTRVL